MSSAESPQGTLPTPLGDLVHKQAHQLEALLRKLRATPGEESFGPLIISNTAHRKDPELFVFAMQLDHPAAQPFDAPTMTGILAVLARLGLGIANACDGFNTTSWLILVTDQPEPVIRYVNMVVFNPDMTKVVGLTKLKGPSFLLGKTCYPGGKLESGESAEEAASREMLEETAVCVPTDQWRCAAFVAGPGFELTTLAAVADISGARQCEKEPVFLVDVVTETRHLRDAKYAPDFSSHLNAALAVV